MKKLILIGMSALALRPRGFSTANAADATSPSTDTKSRLNELETARENDATRIADLERQLLDKSKVIPVDDTSTLAILCKGAGVEISDVRWRVQAGVDLEQAVQAALSQKEYSAGRV
ncbi:MAG: hypothetical protein ABI615_01800 [Chthoniobacterales bacterium]